MRYLKRMLFIVFVITFSLSCHNSSGSGTDELINYFNRKIVPLSDEDDLEYMIKEAGLRRLVLLGESSHGTMEFYQWRAAVTRRLISEKDFSFIAVEGDWAAIYRLNEYVKGYPDAPSSARRVLRQFDRWPEWMWGNTDIEELAEWLKDFNSSLPDNKKIGFYGMDVYGQWDAMDDLLDYTRRHFPDHHREINRNLGCFANYDRDEWVYARAVTGRGHPSCEDELKRVVDLLEENSRELINSAGQDKYFRARQNAFVVRNAEEFYRLAVTDNTNSWNSRATHMWETVNRLFARYGDNSKGIVWAHNTHVGDADATTMRFQNMVNIGKLSRQIMGSDQVYITGFGTFTGRVNAGSSWGSRMERMRVPEGMAGSYESIFGQLDHEQFYILFDEEDRKDPLLSEFRGHRAIGVVYSPSQESGNYVPTILPVRYDSFIFIRETNPLQPVR